MKTIILGAGLSGISTAFFLQQEMPHEEIILLEKEEKPGGLCRTIRKDGYCYDIGPHILFSKDKTMLELLLNVLEEKNDLKRSNKILYKGRHVQYPFENDLSKLPQEDLEYCIHMFGKNPYENYEATNMIQFFLKTFGEGITNCYLRPYNEKIWKYDPSFMDTSMVERIPKPTREELYRSAAGETVDGYLHQLHFSYPARGGIEAVPMGFLRRLEKNRCRVETNSEVTEISKEGEEYLVHTATGSVYKADRLISTIPIQELTRSYKNVTEEIKKRTHDLRYNSILVAFVRTPYDLCGENFAFMIPDKEILFHRISKMDFLGPVYHRGEEATYMVEVTYREGDLVDHLSDPEICKKIAEGIEKIGFALNVSDVAVIDVTRHKYAYVIYDLNHKKNMEYLRKFYSGEGIFLNGRFGNFEYWNMDRILRESFNLSQLITKRV